MVLENYQITVVLLTVQSSLEELLRTIISVAPSLNYHVPQFMSPHRLFLPERTAFQGKGGRLLERITKRIEELRGALQYCYSSTRVHFSTYHFVYGDDGLVSLKSGDLQKAGVHIAELPSS